MIIFLPILAMQFLIAFNVMGWESQSVALKNKQRFATFTHRVNSAHIYMRAEQMLVYTKDTKVILIGGQKLS